MKKILFLYFAVTFISSLSYSAICTVRTSSQFIEEQSEVLTVSINKVVTSNLYTELCGSNLEFILVAKPQDQDVVNHTASIAMVNLPAYFSCENKKLFNSSGDYLGVKTSCFDESSWSFVDVSCRF